MKEYLYTEEVIIPSKGLLNPDIPEGKITLRCVEIRDQKYLSGSKLINKNKSIALLERCIIKPEGLDVGSLSQVDILFLLIKLRILSYGSSYSYYTICPYCGARELTTIDLSDLEVNMLKEDYSDSLVVKLPKRGDTVYTKIKRQCDDDFIVSETNRMKEKFPDLDEDPSITISLAKCIDKIVLTNGKELVDYIDILKYVESLMDIDAIAISDTSDSVRFGINTIITTTCKECKSKYLAPFRTTSEFFRPRYTT